MERDSFIFYKEYKDAIECIENPLERLQFYEYITDYVFYKKIPEKIDSKVYPLFIVIKDKLDVSYTSYHNFEDRRSAKYRKWKNDVLKRDEGKCKRCGSKNNLHIHHIKSFAEYKDLRFEVNNGITLCKKCHKEVHKT